MLDESLSEKRVRKTRRDKGARLLTPRDLWVLRWIGEQYCARFDQVQELLSRQPQHRHQAKAPGPGGLTDSAVDQVVARWQQDPAYVDYKRVYVAMPGWIWLTPYGERALDLPYARHTIRESRFTHRYFVNLVRLDYERRHPEYRWIGERALLAQLPRRDPGEEVPHVPDGEIWLSFDRCIAVEVELSAKSDMEIDAILSELLGRYRAIWYFVSDTDPVRVQAWRVVERAQQRLSPVLRPRVKIIDLKKVGGRFDDAVSTTEATPDGSRA